MHKSAQSCPLSRRRFTWLELITSVTAHMSLPSFLGEAGVRKRLKNVNHTPILRDNVLSTPSLRRRRRWYDKQSERQAI